MCGAGAPNDCVLGGRFHLLASTVEDRGAGDVQGHPLIAIGQGGIGKFVGRALDSATGGHVFIKCRPAPGGQGAIQGLDDWRGKEAERAVHGHPNVLTRISEISMKGGGECSVYPLATSSLTDMIFPESRRESIPISDAEIALLHLIRGINAMHRSGYVHRDIKVCATTDQFSSMP